MAAHQSFKINGIVKVVIIEARDLLNTDTLGLLDPFVTMKVGKKEVTRTPVIGRTDKPVWEYEYSFFCKGKFQQGTAFTFSVFDRDVSMLWNSCGLYHIAIDDVVMRKQMTVNKELMIDYRKYQGTLKVSLDYTETDEVPEGMEVLQVDNIKNDPVQGVVDFYIQSARDLPAEDTFGKSDPFVRTSVAHKKLIKTPVIGNTLLPVWEYKESIFLKGTFFDDSTLDFRCWDKDKVGKDFLGEVKIPIYKLFNESKVGGTFDLERPNKKDKTKMEKSGTLTLDVAFKPYEGETPPEGYPVYDVGDLFYYQWKKDGYKPAEGGVAESTATRSRSAAPKYDPPPTYGVCTFEIQEAEGLKRKDDPYVEVTIADKYKMMATPTIGNTHHPVWEHKQDVYLEGTFLEDTNIVFAVKDSVGGIMGSILGTYSINANSFIQSKKAGGKVDLVDSKGQPAGSLTFKAKFDPKEQGYEPEEGVKIVDTGDLVYKKWKKEGGKIQ